MSLNQVKFYNRFHNNAQFQKRVISKNNFTYCYLIKILEPFLKNSKRILDIGSGVGTIDFYLASKGINVTGIEISPKAVKIAQKNATILGLEKKLEFIVGEFPNYSPKSKFDLIILSEILEHISDDIKSLQLTYKLLNSKGLIVITTPSKNAPLYKLGLLKNFDRDVGHLRRYTLDELSLMLKQCGFKVIYKNKHEGILRNSLFTNNTAGKGIKLLRWKIGFIFNLIDSLTVPLLGESNISIIAKKQSTT